MGIVSNVKALILLFFRRNVHIFYQSLTPANCTNGRCLNLQKAIKQMLEFVPKLTKPGIGEHIFHHKLLSQEEGCCAEIKEKFVHSPFPTYRNYIMIPTRTPQEWLDVEQTQLLIHLLFMIMWMNWIQLSCVVVSK